MRARRCGCGRFMCADSAPTCWAIRVPPGSRQVPDDEWNYFARWRCDACRLDAAAGPWVRPSTLGEVASLRGYGHQPPAMPDEKHEGEL